MALRRPVVASAHPSNETYSLNKEELQKMWRRGEGGGRRRGEEEWRRGEVEERRGAGGIQNLESRPTILWRMG